MKFNKETITSINYYLFLLISFSIPLFRKITPILMVLWALSAIPLLSPSNFRLLKNKTLFKVLSFYFITLIFSFLWTENLKNAFPYLETYLLFLIYPSLFIFTKNYKFQNILSVLGSFIFGNLIALFYNLTRATSRLLSSTEVGILDSLFNKEIKVFFTYTEFSTFHHPSYASMFAVLSIISILYLVFQLNKSKKYLLSLLILVPSIFLYSSKVGIFSLFTILLISILITIIKYKKILISVIVLFLLSSVFILFAKNNARINTLLYQKTFNFNKKNNTNNTDERVLIWQSNIELIKKNILLGTGIGDYKEEIIKIYKKNNFNKGAVKEYNAHNQFIESFASLGILGLINLLAIFTLAIQISIKEKRLFEILFLILILLNLLFESMFNRQSGVIFFIFFFSYLFFSNYSEKNISE